MTELSLRWPEARSIVQDRCDQVVELADDVVNLRLDVRGLLVRVSIYSALFAAVGAAVATPIVYLVLAHFGAHGVQKGATP